MNAEVETPPTKGLGGFRTFWAFLWPRLLLALVFAMFRYTGAGGDTAVYRLLGGYLRDLIMDPANASLMARMEQQQLFSVEESYHRLAVIVQQMYEGDLQTVFGETGLSIVAIHAALYVLWDNILVVTLVQCVASAAAYTVFMRSNRFEGAFGLLRWNPASIFFAATHYKESFTEAALLLLFSKTRGKNWLWKIPVLLFLAFLRIEYVLFALIVYGVMRTRWISTMAWPKLIAGMLLLFLVMPALYADWMIASDSAGSIYSLVYANEVTRRVLGPLIGMLLPMPLLLFGFTSFWGFFYNIYGLFYYVMLARFLRMSVSSGSYRGNPYLNAALIVLALIAYRFTGQSGTSDRYFAPFFAFLIVGFCVKRDETKASLQAGRS